MTIQRLEIEDGSWAAFAFDWQTQCHSFEEDFEAYYDASLRHLAEECEEKNGNNKIGVFSVKYKEEPHAAIFWANLTPLPKISGLTLKIRHLILSPKYDFGTYDETEYVDLLSHIFQQIINHSMSKMRSKHVKVHFRSPADLAMLRNYARYLDEENIFEAVESHGAWIVITKKRFQILAKHITGKEAEMVNQNKTQEAIRNATKRLIESIGVDGLKNTTLFLSKHAEYEMNTQKDKAA